MHQKFEKQPPVKQPPVKQPPAPQKSSRGQKSLSQIVKLQRPEVTRKWKEVNRHRQLMEENKRAANQQKQTQRAAHDPNLLREKQKHYGSKQIPGSSPRLVTPRRVKTYTERLQEMKPKSQNMSSGYVRSRGLSQQSQGSKTSERKKMSMTRTFMRSHGPVHKPKTYAQQLQELSPHPQPHGGKKKSQMHRTVTVSSSSARSRPYSDPYVNMDYEELASVLGDSEMDENLRNIIYGGSTANSSVGFLLDDVDTSLSGGDFRHLVPSSAGQRSDYYDAVMDDSLDLPVRSYMEGDYRESVDIEEIERLAETASVGSGSVIDWDAVADIIKDV